MISSAAGGRTTEDRWRARSGLEVVDDALVVVRGRAVVHVSDAFCDLRGVSREELTTTHAAAMPWWSGDPAEGARLLERTARDARVSVRFELRHADGRAVPVQATLARVDDPALAEPAIVITLRNLADEHAAQEHRLADAQLRSTIETARRLTDLQRAAPSGVAAVLHVLDTILREHLGWFNSILNLRTPTGYTVIWDPRDILTGATYDHDDLDCFTAPVFERCGCWHVPEERSPNPDLSPAYDDPRLASGSGPDAERTGDVLLVPLRSPDGTLLALLSVDGAPGGRRPSDATLEGLATIAENASTALIAAGISRATPGQQLSPREREVLGLLDGPMTSAQIAEHLYVTVNTVRTHITSIYRKLAVHRRDQAVAEGRRQGLIGPGEAPRPG